MAALLSQQGIDVSRAIGSGDDGRHDCGGRLAHILRSFGAAVTCGYGDKIPVVPGSPYEPFWGAAWPQTYRMIRGYAPWTEPYISDAVASEWELD